MWVLIMQNNVDSSELNKKCGERLKQAILSTGPSQKDFAENIAHVTPVHLSAVIRGKRKLTEQLAALAADATGVHLVDLHAGVLEEAAVDGDLAELVFDQHDLFARVGLGDQLFDERRFAGAEKTGENINFCHKRKHFLSGSTRPRNFVYDYSTKL